MLFQTSLGIDIQDHSVSLAYVKASFKGIRLAAYAVYPLEGEAPFEEHLDEIGGLIGDFLTKNRVSAGAVFSGMPRSKAIIRYLELPSAVKENLRESLGYEMEKYIPLPGDDIYFDYQIVSEDKESGKLKLLLVAARREAIDMHLDLAAHIGIGISGSEISSTAIANYFATLEGTDGTGPLAIVSLRDDHLEIDGVKGGFLEYSRWVDLTEWASDPDGVIARELERGKEDLESDQDRLSIAFCGFDEPPEAVENFKLDDNFDIRPIDLSRRGLPSSAMIPAYSLALKGIRKPQTDINLVPKERRRRPNRTGQYTLIALSGLLILLALAWGSGNIISQQLYSRRLNGEIARLGVEVKNIEQTRIQSEKIEIRIDYLNSLYSGRIPLLEVLKELSLSVPKNAWVRRLIISDGKVEMIGAADAASELILSLEASPLFTEVAFLSSITRRGGENKEVFRIGLKLNQPS